MSANKNQPQDLLIEIGTEELPPTALKRLATAFCEGVQAGLEKAPLSFNDIQWYATPRRLALLVTGLETGQADKEVQRRGPALTAAFGEDGCPTQAAIGFAKSCGVEVEDLQQLETDKGAWLAYNVVQKGKTTRELLPDIVQTALDQLPIPKRMRWGDLAAEFVRPVHWLVMLFGDDVVDCEILSVKAGRETRGHRFHHPGNLYLSEPKAYVPLLETEGRVIADFEARREAIRAQVEEAATQLKGKAVIDEELLDEVTAMVEWPEAVTGNFDKRFLDVPPEVLITTMKSNQKYFHVVDKQGKLLPHFITVSNISSNNMDMVRKGNEKVVRPRLEDAEFFWNQDRQTRLDARIDSLASVVFQQKLGTLHDKVQRVARIASTIAEQLELDVPMAERAALISKCDLMTDMVGEFPSLQGTMGRYYAQHDGEDAQIAQAMEEQYQPRFAGDALPESAIGQALSIADKLDTLVGIFAIKQIPGGDKDPFALRRAALGVLRILIEKKLGLNIVQLLHKAAQEYEHKLKDMDREGVVEQCYEFMMDRARGYFLETGVRHDVFDAVLAQRPEEPFDFSERVNAVTAFRRLPEAESLSAANKRIANILKKIDKVDSKINESLLQESAEKDLYQTLQQLTGTVTPLFEQRDYQQALSELARLREPVDRFFDDVMVMVDDDKLKNNRLVLLQSLRSLFLQVADLSRLQG
ncbi:MAG: glycine--tRNA ligase subunit beta [Gammaproteobacteria bacterium]|jgi:glycyl-tRNA synthetase beta chain